MTSTAHTMASLPMAAPRPSETRGRPRGGARLAVEAVLRTADSALSAEEIAGRSGLDLHEARKQIANICKMGHAHNTNPGHRAQARYLRGTLPPPTRAQAAVSVSRVTADHYDGRELRPYEGRPGAMDAFALPSLQGGELVPRRAPRLIGGKPEVRR